MSSSLKKVLLFIKRTSAPVHSSHYDDKKCKLKHFNIQSSRLIGIDQKTNNNNRAMNGNACARKYFSFSSLNRQCHACKDTRSNVRRSTTGATAANTSAQASELSSYLAGRSKHRGSVLFTRSNAIWCFAIASFVYDEFNDKDRHGWLHLSVGSVYEP